MDSCTSAKIKYIRHSAGAIPAHFFVIISIHALTGILGLYFARDGFGVAG
jgi:hypothetical protein